MVDNDSTNGKGSESAVAYAVADRLRYQHALCRGRPRGRRPGGVPGNGVIVEVGPPEKVFDDPVDPRTRRFLRRVGTAQG